MADYGIDESAVYHGPGPKVRPRGNDIPDQAVKFIEANKDRPFYLNVWLHESHLAHTPSAESLERWKHLDDRNRSMRRSSPTATTRWAWSSTRWSGAASRRIPSWFFPAITVRRSRRKTTKACPATGAATTASVKPAACADRKRSLFEGGVRVPFIVRWPGTRSAGVKNDTTVLTAVDLLPTFCAAAGVTPPTDANGDGENLLPAFKGESVLRTRPIFWRINGNRKNPPIVLAEPLCIPCSPMRSPVRSA